MKLQAASRYSWWLFFFLAATAEGNLETPSFGSGILYQYQYSLESQLSFLSRPTLQGSKLQAEVVVDVNLLWSNTDNAGEQLLQIQFHDLRINRDLEKEDQTSQGHSVKGSQNATELQQPFFLHWNKGKVEAFYVAKEENPLILELKRGLLSLLQFQTHSGTVTEEDISGNCQVTYAVSKDTVLKTKDLENCIRPKFGFSTANKIFGLLWHPTSKSHYVIEGNLIKSASSEENHIIYQGIKSSAGFDITSRQHLEFLAQMPGSKELSGKNLQKILNSLLGKPQPISLTSQPFKRICSECPTLRSYLKTFAKKKIKLDLSKAQTTWHFSRVVQMLRSAKKKDILLLLKKAPENMLPFYIEAAIAAHSTPSLVAVTEFMDLEGRKQMSLQENLLYAAALSPRPSKELFRLVLDRLNNKKLTKASWEAGNMIIGSLLGKLCQMNQCGLKEVSFAKEAILKKLHGSKTDWEKMMHLSSLKSTLLPEFIPTFLYYAEEGSSTISAAAVTALKRFSTEHITSTVKMAMRRIFHEVKRKYQKHSRLAAAEILLDNNPSQMDFINIVLASKILSPEMQIFILSKILSIISSDNHPTRQLIKDVLKDPRINNYHYFSPKDGRSISFSGLLAATEDASSTFGVELLFSDFGLLQKSTTNFDIESHGHRLQAAQVVVEAKGLEGLLGGDATEEQVDFKAGMSAILLDVPLRPVTFFDGYSDLMSKMLMSSGEPMKVIKGNLLLVDHQQAVPLQSGLQAVITLQVGLGLDISADVNMNMWAQEFNTSIISRGALTVDFQAEVDTSFFQATLKSQSDIELGTNVEILARLTLGPMLMCLQLAEQPVSYREKFFVSESSANYNTHVRKGRRGTIPGHGFPFYRANSKMCKVLLAGKNLQ
ncbi:microsomal triglyceride transfer protein large subunit-like [Pantherophis guttatus]|uniref:Microsomal triglyceride transfer protein large subunit-like n=1 Tax=Pantherophis guttatus TaxID=94885 RepID=A0A6P9CF53_PANGU|nr:microsomal triglyceride transfer protein large subunit-like [Pantherophis guttatus]